jgi:hypothetical protein
LPAEKTWAEGEGGDDRFGVVANTVKTPIDQMLGPLAAHAARIPFDARSRSYACPRAVVASLGSRSLLVGFGYVVFVRL